MRDESVEKTGDLDEGRLSRSEDFSARLLALLGERFTVKESVTSQYLATEGHLSACIPWGVARPESVEEVIAVHKLSFEYQIPLIPYGSGTSVEGQVAAGDQSLMLDMRLMNRILDIDTESMTVKVQGGVTRLQLDAALKSTGLFFPVDPGADATIGGMAATRASGTNAVRYGTMRENTLALQAVLSNGDLLSCGSQTVKASNGYDLLHLFVGSEGTLGTIVELTVKLFPRPEEVAGGAFCFPDIRSAVAAVVDFKRAGVTVARVELLDAVTVRALNNYCGLSLPETPMLLVELHGSSSVVGEQYAAICEIVEEYPNTTVMYSGDKVQRDQLWAACHKRYYACRGLRPGARTVATDICVPVSRLAQTVEETLSDIAGMPMPISLHGHVGDGNFHTVVLVDETSESEYEAFSAYSQRLAERAIENGGTCSGEHGVGHGKQKYLRKEHGIALDWMQQIKRTFDPKGLMNPGKNIDVPVL
jgi:D-lactate dehydrogenase (cytochrome)